MSEAGPQCGTTMTDDENSEEPAAEPERSDDGLDLAQSITRSLAKAAGRVPDRRRRGGPTQRGKKPASGGQAGSGPRPGDRDPQTLDVTLGGLVSARGWEVDLKVQAMFGRWGELVGAEVAEHTTPESFTEGKLVVRTDSTAWATQLRMLAPSVVRRLNEELGHGTVTLIEVLGPFLPHWKKGRLSSRDGRGPRDTYG